MAPCVSHRVALPAPWPISQVRKSRHKGEIDLGVSRKLPGNQRPDLEDGLQWPQAPRVPAALSRAYPLPQVNQDRTRAEPCRFRQVPEEHTPGHRPSGPGDAGTLLCLSSFLIQSQQLAFIKSNKTLLTPAPRPVT